ncbi:hypothetical protein [Streptomyces sp. NBC_01443]|uniref:hypothetical protein n=1 Tax=Streptomyces sp. NBC_01443 TaxID=2903868 RepID=UPI002254366E|nr:hypothetical protein [Streptomyces sp. NBC_01443]MCX4626597.1 hypothetical protein [Streptomyces sp. NBC_01443]
MPNNLVDWAQVVGSALSLLALVLALYALWKSKRDLARERRRLHDLDLFRDMTDLVSQNEISRWQALGTGNRIMMLDSKDDFPMTRAALRLDSSTDGDLETFDRNFHAYATAHPESFEWTHNQGSNVAVSNTESRWAYINAKPDMKSTSIILDEIRKAIERRME